MKNRSDLKIGVYILSKYAKAAYAKECYNVRLNAGMAVVCDILRRDGFTNIEYCGKSTASHYDMVMFSVTSDCDWWNFVAERVEWEKGNYKVVVGGQGVLNPRPFLEIVDYFVLGRAEGVQSFLAQCILDGIDCENQHIVCSKTFSMDKLYYINQADCIYPHEILLDNGDKYHEDVIGCNHKCFFCGYTWQRKHASDDAFSYSGLWNGGKDRERAMLDMHDGVEVDMVKLRTTAIDGLSERLRKMVNKPITRDILQEFITRLASCEKPHRVKFYNIIGYPTETVDDWFEFLDDVMTCDKKFQRQQKQTCIFLHNTPFRAMPATPLACKPMAYKNFRGEVPKKLSGGKYKGGVFYKGNAIWCVESGYTESLPTVIQSAIIWRGTENDLGNIIKISRSSKFSSANSAVKQKTLEKYFDVGRLFGAYDRNTLPTRNIRTYLPVENAW